MNILDLSGKCEANGDCDLVSHFDVSTCKSYENDFWTPMFYFILSALENFHSWPSTMQDTINDVGTSIGTTATKIVDDFKHDKASEDSTSNSLALASSVLTMLSGALAVCGPCSAVVTVAGGALSMGSGIAGATSDTAAEL